MAQVTRFKDFLLHPCAFYLEPSFPVLFQEPLHLHCRHAPGSSGRDGLTIPSVLHVSAGENSGNARENVIARADVTVIIEVDEVFEHRGVGDVSDA